MECLCIISIVTHKGILSQEPEKQSRSDLKEKEEKMAIAEETRWQEYQKMMQKVYRCYVYLQHC